jgi:hypothetical protein
MVKKIITLFLFIFIIGFTSAIPVCSDINQQDISKVPCTGFTIPINCSGNVTAFNTSNPNINFTFETFLFTDSIYNFTLNLSEGAYNLFDCANNTALIEVKLVEQGFGINLFAIIFPSILLSFISLFISGRMFKKFREEDEDKYEKLKNDNDTDSFVPRNRLIPIIFMLFSFIPIIFMLGFVLNHLQEYLPTSNITQVYGQFYIMFSILFFVIFLISIIVWLSNFIKLRRVMKGLDDID